MPIFHEAFNLKHGISVLQVDRKIYEPHHEKNGFFAYAKRKTQISFAVTMKLIRAFVFDTRIVQSIFYNPKFQASSLLCDCTGRFLSNLVGNPEDRFSSVAAHIV